MRCLRRGARGDIDIEGDGEIAFVGHEPSGYILGYDLYIGAVDHGVLTGYFKGDVAIAFESGHLVGSHGLDCGGHLFHHLAEAWAELLEVGLDALHEDTFARIDYLDLLDVDLAEHELRHGEYVGPLAVVDGGEHDAAERLPYLYGRFAAQGESH